FQVSVGWKSMTVKDDKDVSRAAYNKSFNALVSNVLFEFGMKRWHHKLTYSLDSETPSVPQFRPELNTTNAYFLQGGNPLLKSVTRHRFEWSEILAGQNMQHIDLTTTLELSPNEIVNRTHYFTEATYLPQWRYTALPGSQLSTYDNVQGTWHLMTRLGAETPFTNIKSFLGLSSIYNLAHAPFYFNDIRDVSRVQTMSLGGNFRFNYFRKVRLLLTNLYQYTDSRTKMSDQRFWHWSNKLMTSVELQPLWKYFTFKAFYTFNFERYANRQPVLRQHVVNLSAGAKVFRRRAEVNLMAFDLFRSLERKTVINRENYVTYSSMENYGRYLMVNFVWKYNKVKSNRMNISQGMKW
ncbi:MAG: outer membrane beta-barrel family protein, partial [Prevotella sp.]|nr:outer membrane beta-barrel family protein [Prevotella sp.]